MPDEERSDVISPEALSYLRDVLRSRTPGYVPDGSVEMGTASGPPANGRSSGEGNVAKLADDLLSGAIPASPAHNKQRLYALHAILNEVGPNADSATIERVIKTVHDRQPRFAEPISAHVVAELHDKLQDYKTIAGGDPREFPYLEILGHRRDDLTLNAFDEGFKSGTVRNKTERISELRQINSLLDEIVPDGAHYNTLRQALIEDIVANGKDVSAWAKRDRQIQEERKQTGRRDQKNEKHYFNQKAMAGLEDRIRVPRRDLRRQQQRQLEPNAVELIAELLRGEHAEPDEPAAKRSRGNAGTAIEVGQKQVPEHIRVAVCRPMPGRSGINEPAKEMANRVVEALDAVVKPQRGNFEYRSRVLRSVAQCRDHWLKRGDSDAFASSIAYHFIMNSQLAKSKQQELENLARAAQDYARAWIGQLRELPPRPESRTKDDLDGARKIKPVGRPRGAKALEKAAESSGQSRLTSWFRNSLAAGDARASGSGSTHPPAAQTLGSPSRPPHDSAAEAIGASRTDGIATPPDQREAPRSLDERQNRDRSRSPDTGR